MLSWRIFSIGLLSFWVALSNRCLCEDNNCHNALYLKYRIIIFQLQHHFLHFSFIFPQTLIIDWNPRQKHFIVFILTPCHFIQHYIMVSFVPKWMKCPLFLFPNVLYRKCDYILPVSRESHPVVSSVNSLAPEHHF